MIDVDCPSCGYYLGSLAVKPLQIESVKEATYPQDLDGKGLPGPVSVMQLSEDAFARAADDCDQDGTLTFRARGTSKRQVIDSNTVEFTYDFTP